MQHNPITDQQLDDIAAREAAATKGPWGFYDGDNYADVAADLTMTSRASYSYREKIAQLEDENYWDDPAHEDDDEQRASEQMAANAAFIAHAREDVPLLLAEVRRLRDALAREERLHGDTIDDRDRFHDAADKLAYAVAPEEVIGEHSSMNDPWENALDLITPKAEVDKLRARVAELEGPAVEARAALAALCYDLEDPGTAALSALYLLQRATVGVETPRDDAVEALARHDAQVIRKAAETLEATERDDDAVNLLYLLADATERAAASASAVAVSGGEQ